MPEAAHRHYGSVVCRTKVRAPCWKQPVTTVDEGYCWRSKHHAGRQPIAALDEGDVVSSQTTVRASVLC